MESLRVGLDLLGGGVTALAERGRVSNAEREGVPGQAQRLGITEQRRKGVSDGGQVGEEGRSFSFEGEDGAAAHIGRTGMGEKEQARLIRGRTSQPATARVIHGSALEVL